MIQSFWKKVLKGKPEECWEWQGNILSNGYGRFWWYGRAYSAHRLAWSIANNPETLSAPSLSVLHSCDNRKCCNPAHLREGTTADNMRDKVERGRSAAREANGRARLSEWQVAIVRLLYSQGVLQKYLARDFQVSQTTISAIVRAATWTEEVSYGA